MRRLHVVGAAGKGTAGVAMLAARLGHYVTASDLRANHRTAQLESAGVPVFVGHDAGHVKDVDEVVASVGVPADNPAVVAARRAGKRVLTRMEGLASLLGDREMVSVMGSHGKSTTTALTAAALAGMSPTLYVGADAPGAPCGVRVGTGSIAVVETCEYRDEMFRMRPGTVLLIGLAANHEDWFGHGTAGVVDAFERYLGACRPRLLVACIDSGPVRDLLARLGARAETVTFGTRESADYRVLDRRSDRRGVSFSLRTPGGDVVLAHAPVPGAHGALDAAGALALALARGERREVAVAGLAGAEVPDRRFEVRIDDPSVTVIDDNARIPAQLTATLSAAREVYPERRLLAVCGFWGTLNPRDLDATAASLEKADVVLPLSLGAAALSAGGAEPDDAVERLGILLGDRGVTCRAYDDEILAAELGGGGPVCVLTLGYDGQLASFRHVEGIVRQHLGIPG